MLHRLILLILLVLTGCAGQSETVVIKLAHGLDTTHSVHKGMEFMARRLEEKSGGTMRIDIYPSQQLGTERETLELLQIGSLGMTKVSASVLESFAPSFKIYSLPFLFRDEEHRFKVLESEVGRRLLLSLEKYWLRGLCYYDSGTRSFYTKQRPVETPADLTGLKIRVQESATSMRMVQALGGSPTPIAWGELYTALQQGVVDGAENNPPSFYLSRHYEVCKYYSLNEHTAVPDVMLISTWVWDDLSPEQQRMLQAAADESAEHQAELWKESTAASLKAVQEAGVQVIYPEKEPFMKQVEPMYEEYEKDPAINELIESIRDIS
ncbi:MAG: TRAP transporter substrate-binding protein [Acidobacteriota bacterium]